MKILFLIVTLLCNLVCMAQEIPAYKIYNGKGNETSFRKMIEEISRAQVVLFGEIHNNALAHWLELETGKALLLKHPHLSLGMEMLESDQQALLDEWQKGTIDVNQFLSATKMWDNFNTDYQPLVELFINNKCNIIATNIPRRYANMVYKKGLSSLDSLTIQSKQYVVPIPFPVDSNLKTYKELMNGFGSHSSDQGTNLMRSQAIKDATMAYFISKNLKQPVYHINGSYHSQQYEGINWYLRQTRPELKIANIQVVEQGDISKFDQENAGLGDYIICIPENMTKTY